MNEVILYIFAKRHVVAKNEEVLLSDIATIYCDDKVISAKVKAIKVYRFQKNSTKRCVISIMRIIEMITQACPNVTVESLGETETIIKSSYLQEKEDKFPWIKMTFVSVICFIGTAFTIIAFHNDVGISNVFANIYYTVTGEQTNFHTCLEISYALGLTIGILVFYNRFGKRKTETDPTPLTVEMRVYENQVNDAIIDLAEREKEIIDVDHK